MSIRIKQVRFEGPRLLMTSMTDDLALIIQKECTLLSIECYMHIA